jgi:hypothetical protein
MRVHIAATGCSGSTQFAGKRYFVERYATNIISDTCKPAIVIEIRDSRSK